MSTIHLSQSQARRFLLHRHGLFGPYRFSGKPGIMEFIRQVGCVQFDPIDVCGKNAELVLQSRISPFSKGMLSELLYEDRALVDYFDKNLAIFPVEDWKYFSRTRDHYRRYGKSKIEVDAVVDRVVEEIHRRGALCSRDLDMAEKVDWHWSHTRLSRAALESLYFQGDLVIHHKAGTSKYYALAKDVLPMEILSEPNPYMDDDEFLQWRIRRRIGAVGLLWNRPSDAWLAIDGLRSDSRRKAFDALLDAGGIRSVQVEGIPEPFYYLPEAQGDMDDILSDALVDSNRMELIAPLDNLMWDRRLIQSVFGFSYKWEIYTPVAQRKYGYYVLPMLFGENFIGRAELVCDRKKKELKISKVWLEPSVEADDRTLSAMRGCFRRFAAFNDCTKVVGKLRPIMEHAESPQES